MKTQTQSDALFIGIDIGTSGIRATAINANREVKSEANARFKEFGDDLRSSSLWLETFRHVMKALLDQIDNSAIKAIAVDGTSGTTLAIDEMGNPLSRPLMYNDPVEDEDILSPILQHAPKTSAVHGTNSALARAIKLQSITGIKHIILQADWIAGQLSGRFDCSDANNTLKTGYDPVNDEWPEWINQCGMNMSLLPKVYAPGSPIGTAEGKLAKDFNLPDGIIMVAGTTDGCASFLATGAENSGDGVSVLGTTLTIKLLSDKPIFAPEYGIYSHRLPTGWLAGGASNTGGNVLEYFFKDKDLSALSKKIDVTKSSDLNYYPLVKKGERFPHNDPNFEPRLTPRPDGDAEFLQGILEGIADVESLGYQRLVDLGAPPLNSMRTMGGGSKNEKWQAIRQQKLGVKFLDVLSGEAAAGTAYLALEGAKAAGVL